MTQRTWFITGISSGFGRALATELLERGDRVAGTVRQQEAVAELASAYPERLWVALLDVTAPHDIRTVVDRAFVELGRIDVVINNAGYGLFGAAEELTDEQVQHQISTNLLGSIHVVRAALPHLRAQGGGRIVQMSTYGGQATVAGASLYNASKWGIEGFMEATAKDVAPFGIEVTIVEPGGADTGFRSSGARVATPLAAYNASPASATRGLTISDRPSPGDPVKIASAIIASADRTPAPLRLTLGSDSYQIIHGALSDRLAALDEQRDLAFTTDVSPVQ